MMSKKISEEEQNKFLVKLIKGNPIIYGDFKNSKQVMKQRAEAYECISTAFNQRFKEKLAVAEIKHKWVQLKKGFIKSHKKLLVNKDAQKYYLFNEMKFLLNTKSFINGVIELSSDEDEDGNEDFNDENNKYQVTYDKENEEESAITFDDVLRVTGNINSNTPLCTRTNIQSMNASVKLVPPPSSKNYCKKRKEIDDLEKNLMSGALQILRNVTPAKENVSFRHNSQDDCYILSIEEALKNVPQPQLLQCVNKILSIIKSHCDTM